MRLLVLTGLELLNEPDDGSVWALLRAQDEKIPCCVITEKEIFITPDEWLGRVYEIEKTQGDEFRFPNSDDPGRALFVITSPSTRKHF